MPRLPIPGWSPPSQVAEAVARLRAEHRDDPAAAGLHRRVRLPGPDPARPDADQGRRLLSATPRRWSGWRKALDGRRLVLKPHPLAPDNPLLGALQQRFAGQLTEANVYALLAAASDVQLLTISSSAAIEAAPLRAPRRDAPSRGPRRPAPFTSLWAHRSAAFWRAALAPDPAVRADAAFEERTIPDRLRGASAPGASPAPRRRRPRPVPRQSMPPQGRWERA